MPAKPQHLTEQERDRLTARALEMQQNVRKRRSKLEPYKEWIREMIEKQGITFRVITQVLEKECQIKITEQSLNEWYHRHIGPPPRGRGGKLKAKTKTAAGMNGNRNGHPDRQNPRRSRLNYSSPEDWKIV